MVEQGTENPRAGGSSPSLTTMNTTAPATGLLLFRGSPGDLNPERAEQPSGLFVAEPQARPALAQQAPKSLPDHHEHYSPSHGAVAFPGASERIPGRQKGSANESADPFDAVRVSACR